MKPLNENQHVLFILKVKYSDNQIKTLCNKQTIDKGSKIALLDLILEKLGHSTEAYSTTPIIEIIFYYKINEGKIIPNIDNSKGSITLPKFQLFYKNKLPIAYKPEDYGVISWNAGNYYSIYTDKAHIMLEKKENNGEIIYDVKYFKNKKLVFTWIDKLIAEDYLVRSIGNSTYHYIKGRLELIRTERKTSPISKTKVNKASIIE